MSRTTMTMLAGLMALGCIVAMLPAQESSRRTASKYKPGANPWPSGGERQSLSPPPGASLPPVVPAQPQSGGRSEYSVFGPPASINESATSESIPADPNSGPPSTAAFDAAVAAGEQFPANEAATEVDGSQLHSVLKRPAPPTSYQPSAPATAPATLSKMPSNF